MSDGALASVVALWVLVDSARGISGRLKESAAAVVKPLPKNSAYKAPRDKILV